MICFDKTSTFWVKLLPNQVELVDSLTTNLQSLLSCGVCETLKDNSNEQIDEYEWDDDHETDEVYSIAPLQ